jgi:hypothetical protein
MGRSAGQIVEWVQLSFLLKDFSQLLKVVTLVGVPLAAVATVVGYFLIRRWHSP